MPGPVDNDPQSTALLAEAAELKARTARALGVVLGFVRVVTEDSTRMSDYRTEYPGVETGSELHEGLINVGKRIFATHYLIENEEGEEGEGHTEQTAAIRAGFDRYWTGMRQALEIIVGEVDDAEQASIDSEFPGGPVVVANIEAEISRDISSLPDLVANGLQLNSNDLLPLAGAEFAQANARILVHTVDSYVE